MNVVSISSPFCLYLASSLGFNLFDKNNVFKICVRLQNKQKNKNPVILLHPTQVVLTARHSHGSPFALIESWVCHLLFGSPLGGSEEEHQHPPAAVPSSPVKTREDVGEGTRKRKAKKAE